MSEVWLDSRLSICELTDVISGHHSVPKNWNVGVTIDRIHARLIAMKIANASREKAERLNLSPDHPEYKGER